MNSDLTEGQQITDVDDINFLKNHFDHQSCKVQFPTLGIFDELTHGMQWKQFEDSNVIWEEHDLCDQMY